MNKKTFDKLALLGHWFGMFLIVLGVIYSFKSDEIWPFILGFFTYWLINYAIIRGLVDLYLTDKTQ